MFYLRYSFDNSNRRIYLAGQFTAGISRDGDLESDSHKLLWYEITTSPRYLYRQGQTTQTQNQKTRSSAVEAYTPRAARAQVDQMRKKLNQQSVTVSSSFTTLLQILYRFTVYNTKDIAFSDQLVETVSAWSEYRLDRTAHQDENTVIGPRSLWHQAYIPVPRSLAFWIYRLLQLARAADAVSTAGLIERKW